MNPSVASTGIPTAAKDSAPQVISDPQLWSPANPHFVPQKNTVLPAAPPTFLDPATAPLTSQQAAPTTILLQPAPQNQPEVPMDANMISDCYASLLGLAETFRTMSPPNMRLAVHCLKAALNLKLPVNLEARTHLQIGRLLFHYSKSDEQTKSHLEKARTLGAHLRAKDDSIKFEAAALLAEFFERKGKRYEAICILNDAIRLSNNNPYWHCRLLLELAQAHVTERDVNSACEILAMGSEFAQMHNSDYTRGLFLLSKCMLLLASRQLPEVTSTLSIVNRLIEKFRGTEYHREALRVFYLVLHVSFYLLSGQAKSTRPILKQLHQSIQQFAAMDEVAEGAIMNEIDRFQWMPREHMVILVYLITVMHWMQVGMLDRAKRSAEKALTQIEKLSVFDTSPLLTVFHLSLLEHTAMGRLVMGVQTAAAQDIGQACRICQANPGMMFKRLPQLHTLIGLYAMSMNCMDHAENQFKYALRLIAGPRVGLTELPGGATNALSLPLTNWASCQPDGPRDTLSVLICLNLALVHIRKGHTTECEALLNEVFTSGMHILDGCYCLRAAASYVRAFQAFYENRLSDAKAHLRETVRLGKEEELHRLSASAFVTMGQIHLNEGNTSEGFKMTSAAIHVANRLPDIGIQLWASALLKGVANLRGNTEQETHWFSEHGRFSKLVIDEHMRAISAPEHRLIEWLDGPFKDWHPSQALPSTSDSRLL
ncbi:Mau2 chromatid cohesion factor [Fasciola gigantica]|uniref:MAU2 chromatid cohesion factor homolog n=1 Tax=Fasciola gigantica TaxID=46835 RepID=A0A504Y7L2_FASGI|nr:Mau2 chromatid cohesion factor [Fasciola gigantica]